MFKAFKQFGGLPKENYVLFIGKLVTSMGAFVWPMLTFFMTTKLGYSDTKAALILSIETLVSFPFCLLGGYLADKYDKKSIIIIFDLIGVSCYFISSIVPFSFWTIAIIFMGAVSQSLESPAYDALIADFSSSEQREKACSLNYLGFNLGFVLGAAFSGILFVSHTRLCFVLNGVSILISTILIFFFIHSSNKISDDNKEEISHSIYEDPVDNSINAFKILWDRKTPLFMIFIFVIAWSSSTVNSILLPLKLKSLFNEYGATTYGYLSSLNGLTVILFTPLYSLIMDKVDEMPKTSLGMALYISGMIMFSLSNNTKLYYLAMFIFTLGEISLVVGASPYMSRRIPLTHRGRVSGASSVIQTILASLFQYLISILLTITNSNYSFIYTIFIIISSFFALLCILLYKKDKEIFPLLYKK